MKHPQSMVEDSNSSPAVAPTNDVNRLQWFREGVGAIISLVILAVAAVMLYGTHNYAKNLPASTEPAVVQTHKDAYERQKDVMLYAIALLGTVTGYYLGRVPAELHAQQAQKSAHTAQAQLQKTQTKLTETAGQTAAAAARVAVAEHERDAVKSKVRRAVKALESAKTVIASNGSRSPREKVLGEQFSEDAHAQRHAEKEIDEALGSLRDFVE
jgi:hypothetical protein